MVYKIVTVVLFIVIPLSINADDLSRAKIFGIAGFAFSLFAIGADISADYYYTKYEESTYSADCSHYKNRTIICERTRDILFVVAALNFSVSTIFILKNNKKSLGVDVHLREGKLCAGLTKFIY
ncbi:hypothetical protein AMJ52_06325 [candidate division TA06 bacterium DG_78]|uniref:Uncharacterized protein n=1 Tax=candidate division TA06 bacterium DG_78 TaxID=1703772 RepID=A0A0S7YEC4_UNCT6|nr:MAG: hypothetical protein AMJ52_06325 [candidate division TA06 bacterium DG_78]